MYKDDVASILGLALSTFLSALSFIYSLGVLQLLFPYLAGAFTTYLIQHRLQTESEKRAIKRQNYDLMRERIYGPMLEHLSLIIDSVREFGNYQQYGEKPNWNQTSRDHLFHSVPSNLRTELSNLLDRYQKYDEMKFPAQLALNKIISKETLKFSKGTYEPDNVCIRLQIEDIMIAYLSLKQGVFLGISPKAFVLKNTEKWEPSIPLKPNCSPDFLDIVAYELLYASVLSQIEKNPLFIEEKNQRMRLLEQLEKFSEKIRPLVNLS